MGLLDDAIREHLDLKRRRGADPAEVERAEREALGPVRRGPEQPEPEDAGVDEAVAYDHDGDQDWGVPFDDADGLATPQPGEPESFAPSAPFDEEQTRVHEQPSRRASLDPVDPVEPEEPLGPEDRVAEDPFASEEESAHDEPFAGPPRGAAMPPPHPAPASPPPEPREHVGEETVEYEVEAALEQEGKPAADDVLEETPEFLQDTPDHDRLWFEQRPPRDFDFEG